ncbi:MAG: hypothetical protein D6679_14430 [Candidatus Hydrogenedentota bacterium]|nr:MAG: hypothetical protein D6679_14430 [Candidatus Hydrogenedentota bacterium]
MGEAKEKMNAIRSIPEGSMAKSGHFVPNGAFSSGKPRLNSNHLKEAQTLQSAAESGSAGLPAGRQASCLQVTVLFRRLENQRPIFAALWSADSPVCGVMAGKQS